MKSSRSMLPKPVALPPSYDSFFSFPLNKSGYSGVAVYARSSSALPLRAEEGLSGLLQPKPPLSDEERISQTGGYPNELEMRRLAEEDEPEDGDLWQELDLRDLDAEGRALVLDFGLFVLINVYCPNDGTGTDERLKYKMDFHHMLEARVRGLVKEGREVVLVGDMNVCVAVEDHCEGELIVKRGLEEGKEGEGGFWDHPGRRWMRRFLESGEGEGRGCMIDIVRRFWPNRKGMYTCTSPKLLSVSLLILTLYLS